ncbi:MAG: multidrug efflux RND transporter permease subunit [Campylobacterales bacterium]|nr:multidrug efflux RND transporter permease subunit [Campylobacterales bacterium]
MFSKFFIYRPIFASVVSIIIIFAGIMSINNLPIKEYPAITPPQINVNVFYPGADADTLNKTVASPLEQAINGVNNMTYLTTTASPNGALSVSVIFEVGTDVAQAKVDVNNRVQLATAKLPEEVKRQGISVEERSPDMLKVLAFSSKENIHDTVFISNYVTLNVVDDLKRIPGIGQVTVFGAKDYAVRVWIDPEKLSFYNLTTSDITSIIRSQNNQYPAGSIGDQPDTKQISFTYNVTTEGRLKSVEDFKELIIRSNEDGSSLKLKDLARIELGADEYGIAAKYSTAPMIPVGIFLSAGANALDVSKEITATMERLEKKFPEDLYYEVPYDATQFVERSIKEVVKTLLEAIVFVVILIYLFLGNFRATVIPVLAIPVAVIGTFAGLYVFGYSINLLTLFGMILAIGLVVDDAIIVIENVERNIHTRKIGVKKATEEAMKELTVPLIAIIMVLAAVFVPAALSGGFSGVMYQQFSVTIIIAVIISGIVALTLTPALCALFLQENEPKPFWFIQKFNQFFDIQTKIFIFATQKTIKFWYFSLILFGGLLYLTYTTIQKTSTGLVPNEDKGSLMVLIYMMPGTSLEQGSKITDEIEKQLLANPNIKGTGNITGLDITTFSIKGDSALMFAKLKPWEERLDPSQSATAIAQQLMGQFMMTSKDAFVIPVNPPPIRGMSTTGGFEMWIQDRTGGNIQALNDIVNKVIAKANEDPRLSGVRTTLAARTPKYELTIDKEKAKALGVSTDAIFSAIQGSLAKGYINDFNMFGRTYKVDIQSDASYRATKEHISKVYVRSNTQALIPASELLNLQRIVGASVIQRFNMFTAAKVTGSPGKGYASGDATKAIEQIAKEILPDGYTIAWSGTTYQEKKLEKEGNYTTLYAALFVFLILAALYESWTIPFAVIISIPFAIFGAALAVYLRELQVDVYFQVGLITLVGLSAKNAILIVEFTMAKLGQGYELLEATIEAARLRFRPIVMTSLAFIAGTLPLVFSTGAGSASRHIIGTTVVGGMLAAMIIGIVFIPLFFYLTIRIKQFFIKK